MRSRACDVSFVELLNAAPTLVSITPAAPTTSYGLTYSVPAAAPALRNTLTH